MTALSTWLSQITAHSLSEEPGWLSAYREEAKTYLQKEGLPTTKTERFKYLNLSSVYEELIQKKLTPFDDIFSSIKKPHHIVLQNGKLVSKSEDLSRDLIVCSLKEAIALYPTLIESYFKTTHFSPFTALNACLFTEGMFFYVPHHIKIPDPIWIYADLNSNTDLLSNERHVFLLGENSSVTLMMEQTASNKTLSNSVLQVKLSQEAKLNFYEIQNADSLAAIFSHVDFYQEEKSEVSHVSLAHGARFFRHDLCAYLNAPRAHFHTAGFYQLNHKEQTIDHHIDVFHQGAHSESEMLYKGILDRDSRAIFNGKLLVLQGAHQITAYQGNHHLLLSDTAESYAKPELEIYAEDVKCKHGATTGQLDKEQLFYLISRGIDKKTATAMLLSGFADEVFNKIKNTMIQDYFKQQILHCDLS